MRIYLGTVLALLFIVFLFIFVSFASGILGKGNKEVDDFCINNGYDFGSYQGWFYWSTCTKIVNNTVYDVRIEKLNGQYYFREKETAK